jgi:hypothetical protein
MNGQLAPVVPVLAGPQGGGASGESTPPPSTLPVAPDSHGRPPDNRHLRATAVDRANIPRRARAPHRRLADVLTPDTTQPVPRVP